MKIKLPLLILFCLGCETVVDVSLPGYDSKPVLTSFFSPDSTWSVTMHSSLGGTVKRDAISEYISDASVMIMNGSNMIDILSYQGNGRYVSSMDESPKYGVPYTIRVDLSGKVSIAASSLAPPPVIITDYSIEALPQSPESDLVPAETKYQLKIVFSDLPGMNFYRVGVYRFRRNQANLFWGIGPDSIYNTISFNGVSPGWSCGYFPDDGVTVDPGDIGGVGILDCEEFIAEDRLFDGKDYSWSGTTYRGFPDKDDLGRKEFRLIISSLSEDYYRYLHSLERNVFHDPLTEEPFPMYSNVNGGLGIFAGYTNTNLIIPFPTED